MYGFSSFASNSSRFFLLPGHSYFNERSSLDGLNLAFLWFAQPWFRGHGDTSLIRSYADEYWLSGGKVRNDNSGIAGSAVFFSFPES